MSGEDFIAKYTFCRGLRLIITKVRELFKFANTINKAQIISFRKPIYWSTTSNELPDLIDFYVMKDIPSNYTEVEGLIVIEETSDHILVLF